MSATQFQVGPQQLQDGSPNTGRSGKTGETVVGFAHARHYEAVVRGNVFIGADLGGTPVTTQAGLSATTPALTLYNPVGSIFNLVLLTVTIAITSTPGGAAGLMLAYNLPTAAAPTATTNATIQNALTSSLATGVGQCYRIATLATAPLALRFMGGPTGASITGGQWVDNVDGGIIVGPGVALSIQTTAALALLAGFVWEEVRI